jgi:hypothetical protein
MSRPPLTAQLDVRELDAEGVISSQNATMLEPMRAAVDHYFADWQG